MIRTALWISMLALPALGQDRDGIATVITDQLDAFEARDLSRAFDFASPSIQSLFGSDANFGHMVQYGYPMVWDHSEARFLGLTQLGTRWVQRVMLTDADGSIYLLDYYMIETADGWRVDGVDMVDAPAPTV